MMRKVVDVLGCTIIVALVWLCSQLIGQAVDKDTVNRPPRVWDNPDWYLSERGAAHGEQITNRYLEVAKRYVEVQMREGRSARIEEVTKAFEEEVGQLEAAAKRRADEMEAQKKLDAVKSLLEEIVEKHPNSHASKVAKRSIGVMGATISDEGPFGQVDPPRVPTPAPATTTLVPGAYLPPAVDK